MTPSNSTFFTHAPTYSFLEDLLSCETRSNPGPGDQLPPSTSSLQVNSGLFNWPVEPNITQDSYFSEYLIPIIATPSPYWSFPSPIASKRVQAKEGEGATVEKPVSWIVHDHSDSITQGRTYYRLDRIRRLAKQNLSRDQITKEAGLTHDADKKIITSNKTISKSSTVIRRPWKQSELNSLLELWKGGWTVHQISDYLERTEKAVKTKLHLMKRTTPHAFDPQ